MNVPTKLPSLAPRTEFQNFAQSTTLLTKNTGSDSLILYTGDKTRWTRISLRLVSAGGEVAIGFVTSIAPPLSGLGQQLLFDSPVQLTVPPGQRVYYAADSLQRIAFSVEPLPWLEQILETSKGILGAMAGLVRPAAAVASSAAQVAQTTTQKLLNIASPPTPRRVNPQAGGRSPEMPSPPPGVVRYRNR